VGLPGLFVSFDDFDGPGKAHKCYSDTTHPTTPLTYPTTPPASPGESREMLAKDFTAQGP